MPPLTGVLGADFASFDTAVQKSVVELKGFETGGAKVEAALNRVSNSFTGTKVIQDATIAAAAIDRIGGVSNLTARELARIGPIALEARAKLLAMGQDVPPKIQAIADAARNMNNQMGTATPGVGRLATSMGMFNSALSASGVSLGPQLGALGELGGVAGKTASQVGLVASAGLAAAAAMGGWKIGRTVSEMFGLDQKIGDVTASLLGWGDASALAGNNADVLARATARAGFAVTDLTTAIEINKGAQAAARTNLEVSADAVASWRAELAKVGDEMPSLTADLGSQNFSLKDLSDRYHISIEALQFFQREQGKAATATKEATAAIEDHNTKVLAALEKELAARARLKVEITKLDAEYAVTASARGETANQQEIARINASFEVQKAAMQRAGTFSAEAAAKHQRNWEQALEGVGIAYDTLTGRSITAMQQRADNELKTYNEMLTRGGFHREELEKQLQKYNELQAAASGFGQAAVAAQEAAGAAAAKTTSDLIAMAEDAWNRGKEKREKPFKLDKVSDSDARRLTDDQLQEIEDYKQGKVLVGYGPIQAYWAEIRRMTENFIAQNKRNEQLQAIADAAAAKAAKALAAVPVLSTSSGSGGARTASAGVVVQNTFQVVDTEANIVRRVSDAITRTVLQGQRLGARG